MFEKFQAAAIILPLKVLIFFVNAQKRIILIEIGNIIIYKEVIPLSIRILEFTKCKFAFYSW